MARQHSTSHSFPLDAHIIDRFWQNVTRCAHGEQCAHCCWLWHGYKGKRAKQHQSYGRFFIYPYHHAAHRVAYIITYGYIFPGLYICHRCDVPLCVNPAHLWPGTPTDNVHDTMRKGRARAFDGDAHKKLLQEHPEYVFKGEQVGTSKLTENQVLAIRRAAKMHQHHRAIAKQFDVSLAAIRHIIYRQTWKHLPED